MTLSGVGEVRPAQGACGSHQLQGLGIRGVEDSEGLGGVIRWPAATRAARPANPAASLPGWWELPIVWVTVMAGAFRYGAVRGSIAGARMKGPRNDQLNTVQ